MPEQHPLLGANEEPDGQVDHAHDEANLPPLGLRHVTRAEHHRPGPDAILREAAVDVAQGAEADRRRKRRDAASISSASESGNSALMWAVALAKK